MSKSVSSQHEDALKRRTAELIEKNQYLEQTLLELFEEMKNIKNLLNHSGKGLLSFGNDMLIDPGYSIECRLMFHQDIEGKEFPDLVFVNNRASREFYKKTLIELFTEEDEAKTALIIGLLQREFIIFDRNIEVDYKLIDDPYKPRNKKMIVVLNDITERNELFNEVEEERNILRMIEKAVTNYDDMKETIGDFRNFLNRLNFTLTEASDFKQALSMLLRKIHTFNGLFSQMEMVNIVKTLHSLETEISRLHDNYSDTTREELLKLLVKKDMAKVLETDLEIIYERLGKDYFNRSTTVSIEPAKIIEIEDVIENLLPPDQKDVIVPYFRKLRYKSFAYLLQGYPSYVNRLAAKLKKHINPFVISGGDIAVDPNRFKPFTKTLVHIFRNCIDHGIESVEERAQAGKEVMGTITCRVDKTGDNISLVIADNGRGIDLEKIREFAIRKGIYSAQEAAELSKEQIMDIIFLDRFTTAEESNHNSGRGVGLPAVKAELDAIDGTLEIESAKGEGTSFHFTLPVKDTVIEPVDSLSDLINAAVEFSKSEILNDNEISITDCDAYITQYDTIDLLDYTNIVSVTGLLTGILICTFDNTLAKNIAKKLLTVSIETEESSTEMGLAKFCELITDESLLSLSASKSMIKVSQAFILSSDNAILKNDKKNIWSCNISTNKGSYSINYVNLL